MKKNIKYFVIFIVLMVGMFLKNYSYSEPVDNTGDTIQPFDATININFLDCDGSQWQFDNYDNLPELIAFDFNYNLLKGVNYEYSWSNGQTGNGTIDDEGKINIKPIEGTTNTSLSISIKNCTQGFAVYVPKIDKRVYAIQNVYSDVHYCYPSNNIGWESGGRIYVQGSGSTNIDLYKSLSATMNIKFLHNDGSEWVLNGNNKFPELNIIDSLMVPEYYGEYNNNNNSYVNYGTKIYFCGSNQYEDEMANGNSELKLTIYGIDNKTKLNVEKLDVRTFSKVCINGVEHEFVETKDEEYIETIDLKPGETVNLEYYIAETATGTVGIDSYDGSLSEDFVWNLHFDMMDGEYSNEDYSNVYWMFEGDDTKYSPIKKNGEYAFDIQIPFGKRVKLYNLPVNAMFHNGESFKYNELTVNNTISSFTQSPFSGKTVITYKGESLTSELIEKLGVSERTYYTSKSGGNEKPIYVDTSGYLNNFNIRDGFEINWYVFRYPTQIMFQKDYEETIDIEEKNKQFHFRVKLIDTLTQKPLSGKIAYYIYSDKEQVVDIVKDVKYTILDSDGYMDIYLKAGEYVRIGKTITDEEISLKNLRAQYMSKKETYINSNEEELISWQYFNDLGMLPYGVEYTIEEVDDTYNSVVDKEGAEKGVSKYMYAGEYDKVKYTAKNYYGYLDGFKFINNRKPGSLTIQKVVEGKETDKTFKFNIKITDAATKFPLEYECVDENGLVGKINFVEGDKITEDDISVETVKKSRYVEVAKGGSKADPETKDIEKYTIGNLVLWDTPGLGDGTEIDEHHKEVITELLREKDEDGNALIDLVLVILDGSTRDLGTSYKILNDVIIPELGGENNRILVALNQADIAMKTGRHWDYEKNEPDETLVKFLEEKVESIKARIKEDSNLDVEPIYYCAGYEEESGDVVRLADSEFRVIL